MGDTRISSRNSLRISQYFFRRFPSENIFHHRLSKSKDKSPKPFIFHRVLPLKYRIPNGNYHILMVTNINKTNNIHGNYMVITHKNCTIKWWFNGDQLHSIRIFYGEIPVFSTLKMVVWLIIGDGHIMEIHGIFLDIPSAIASNLVLAGQSPNQMDFLSFSFNRTILHICSLRRLLLAEEAFIELDTSIVNGMRDSGICHDAHPERSSAIATTAATCLCHMLKRSVATLRAFQTVDGFIISGTFFVSTWEELNVLFHLPQNTKHSLTCHIYVHAELNHGF